MKAIQKIICTVFDVYFYHTPVCVCICVGTYVSVALLLALVQVKNFFTFDSSYLCVCRCLHF